jgi:hypothetical protein
MPAPNQFHIVGVPAEPPWEGFYYYTSWSKKDERYYVVLIAAKKVGRRREQHTISKARYLMSVHLGRRLRPEEHVDHVNNIKTDDRIENLQILSIGENTRKYMLQAGKANIMLDLVCPICKQHYQTMRGKYNRKLSRGTTPTCSYACAMGAWRRKSAT